jgi:hypothetical protein
MTIARGLTLIALFACSTLPCAGCTAASACDAESPGMGTTVGSTSFTGTAELAKLGDTVTLDFDAQLGGLPELTPPGGVIQDSLLELTLKLRYATAPMGGDGLTEMPRLQARFYGAQSGLTTSSFPYETDDVGIEILRDCDSAPDIPCCPRGVTHCERTVHVELVRIDGAPFPPVQLTWTATAIATLNNCPSSLSSPQITLVSDAP